MRKIFTICIFFISYSCYSATYYSRINGSWNVSTTWSTVSCSGVPAASIPGAADNVIICAGKTVNINVASSCNSLIINSTGIANFTAAVTCAIANTLTVSGTITGTQTGTFTASNMDIPSGQIATIDRGNITISGMLTISGSYLINNITGVKSFNNVTLNSGGDWTANVNNPVISISGNFIMVDGSIIQGTIGNLAQYTIGGTFTCNAAAGTSDIAKCDLTIQGLTTLNGEFRFTASGAGIKTFNGGILLNPGSQFDNTVGEDPFINGSIVNNGTWSDGTGGACTYTFGNAGNYSISGNPMIMSAINILAGSTVTNLGAITVKKNNGITGAGSFYNGNGTTDAYLEFRGNPVYNIAFFDASSINNTVEYGRTGNQTIGTPNGSIYYNLIASGSGNKSLLNPINILNDITISSTFQTNNNNISIGGSWNELGTLNVGTSTINFNGSINQSINAPYNPLGETFYNLTLTNTGTGITLTSDVTVTNVFAMNGGNLNTQTNLLTLGNSTGNVGTLSRTAGTIIGKFQRWINATGTNILFPVGTAAFYRPADLLFTNLTSGSLIVEFNPSNPGNIGLPLVDAGTTLYNTFGEGYWGMTATNGLSSNNFNNQLTGNGFSSFPIIGPTRLLSRSNSISPWLANGVHVAAVGSIAKRNNVSLISGEYVFADTTNCVTPASTSAITGLISVCKNQAGVVYSVTNTPGNTYTWTITGGVITAGAGTNAITVNWGAVGMTGNVAVYQNNGCTNSPTTNLSVSVNTMPTSAITGPISIAANTTGVSYSVTNVAGYTYTWAVTGGTIASGQGTNLLTVDWGSAGSGTVTCTGSDACGSAAPVIINVIIYPIITSVTTGNWNVPSTWDCACIPQTTNSVRIDVGHTVTLVANTTIKHFTIRTGATMDDATFTFTATGDYINNGIQTGTKPIELTGNSTIIDGSGTIANSDIFRIRSFDKIISSTANLTKINGNFSIDNNLIVVNNGTFTIVGDLIGGNASTQWINAMNSNLNITGVLLNGIPVLNATAIGNTVKYNGTVNQNIKQPVLSTYYNLVTDGSANKIMQSSLTILNDLTITGASQFNVNNNANDINIGGDWLNNSINADPFFQMAAIVTFDGSTSQLITNVADETFYNLVENQASGSLNLAPLTDITVTNLLTLTRGIIYTNGNTVIIPDNSTATSGNTLSFVDGVIKKIGNDAFVFPVGNALIWARIAISAPASVSTEFTGQYFNAPNPYAGVTAPLTDISYMEYWMLNRAVTADNVTVKLFWENNVRSGINNSADLTVSKWNGTSWIDMGQGAISYAAQGNITSNLVTSFSPFAFGSKSLVVNPLPIELLSFTATPVGNIVEINWTTATETNNDFFSIEKTIDGYNYDFVGTVDGAGNSTNTLNYSITDNNPFIGLSYYRLKQTDFNGDYTYSPLASVNFNLTTDFDFEIFPNPNEGENINISFNAIQGEEVLVVVYDVNGKESYSKIIISQQDGENIYAIDPSSKLSSGTYFITAASQQKIYNKKLIIK